ncbi:TlpA family protein disulfide reductase, partial [Rhodococcus aerolatus]
APAPGAGASRGPLAGLTLPCLADGSPVDLGTALAGRPVLLNVWAWWCGPCAAELPAVQDFAARAGDRVTVLTVHADPDAGGALSRLTDYGVRLPGVQDADGRVAALVGAPQVLPTTILLRADGTVAAVLPQPFTTADEVATAVADGLGVRT